MMWEACAEKVRARGGRVLMGATVSELAHDRSAGRWTVAASRRGTREQVVAEHVVSSVPLRSLVRMLRPQLSQRAHDAAGALRYRDFLTVMLVLKDAKRFDDNWIYIQDPGVKVGRVQNFKSWSPEMVPDPRMNCYGLEYFCFEGDGLWRSSDETLIELGKTELCERLGLARREDVTDGCVV